MRTERLRFARSGLLLACALFVACRAYEAHPPEGFAAYDASGPYRAVSPDGVVFRVRQEANKPEADLAFWKQALKKRMLDAGYTLQAEGDIKAKTGEAGALLELSAPIGALDYSYLVAIYAKGKHVVIAEAAGDVVRLKQRREAVLAALQATELK